MAVLTATVEPIGLRGTGAAASGVMPRHQDVKAVSWARRGTRLLEDGVLLLLLPYAFAIATILVCLPFALLFALARWFGS